MGLPHRAKTSEGENLANLELLAKFSSQNLGVWHSLAAQASNPQKCSPQKLHFRQFAKVFSLKSFLLYSILMHILPYCSPIIFSLCHPDKTKCSLPYGSQRVILVAVLPLFCHLFVLLLPRVRGGWVGRETHIWRNDL